MGSEAHDRTEEEVIPEVERAYSRAAGSRSGTDSNHHYGLGEGPFLFTYCLSARTVREFAHLTSDGAEK